MTHPQHNFTSNFNGSEGHNAELTLNINGTEHKYTPAGNDKEFTVTGAVRINVNLDGSELVERITTVLNGDSLPLLVQQNLDGTEDSYTYVGLQDNEWIFGRVTTTHIDSVAVSTSDGAVRHETLALASDVAIVAYNDPAVYTKLRTAVALGHLPVLDYQGTYATYVTIDNNILKFATEAADPNVESYVYTVASDNTVTATPRNAGVVRADSVDTEPGTLIDKLEVVDNVRDPDDPTDEPLLSLNVTTDGQGNRKVAINEDNLRTFADDITNTVLDIIDTLDSMDFDEVPHGSFGSSLNQSPGDGTSTSILVDIFRPLETTVGEAIEWTKTTEIGGADFGTVTLEPGTYIICSDITCQWVGVPAGTYLPQVGNVLGEPFDFSQQQEVHRRMTNVVTVSTATQFKMRINFDAATPVMGFWINSAQIIKIAGGMSQTNVTHDNTLTGKGSVADPLGVNTQNVAQATLAGNVAQAFDPNKPNDENGYAYYKDQIVIYSGLSYRFLKNHLSGAWDASEVERFVFANTLYVLKMYDNPEMMFCMTDLDGRVISYVDYTGKFHFVLGADFGNLDNDAIQCVSLADSEGFKFLIKDSANHILLGIDSDGALVLGSDSVVISAIRKYLGTYKNSNFEFGPDNPNTYAIFGMHSEGARIRNCVAFGYNNLRNNTGVKNSAFGIDNMQNCTGHDNTALGYHSQYRTTSADGGTSVGAESMDDNTTGTYNTAIGYCALQRNNGGNHNVAVGSFAIQGPYVQYESETPKTYAKNTVVGYAALASALTGSNRNVAIGYEALKSNRRYENCIAIGAGADCQSDNETVIGNNDTERTTVCGDFVVKGTDGVMRKIVFNQDGTCSWLRLN